MPAREQPDTLSLLRGVRRPEIWAGPECSFLTVGDWRCDQLALTGHDGRADDIDRLASLGVRAVRYPILWGRADPPALATDWAWADARLGRLADLGIEPIAGLLHHGFGPLDPFDPDWPSAFGRYALEVARRYPDVTTFLPINEPLTTARFGALYGWWPPYARDDDTFVRLMLAQASAYLEAAHAIRSVTPAARLIITEDFGRTVGTAACAAAVDHANQRRWLTWDLVTGNVDHRHPLWSYLTSTADHRRILERLRSEPELPDVLGINHYITSDRYLDHRVEWFPKASHGGGHRAAYADVESARVAGFDMPGFDRSIREVWARYGLPVALTEVQLAGQTDHQIAWWAEAWSATRNAVTAGIPVVAVTAWSAFGAYDWSSVLRAPCGAYEAGAFDVSAVGVPRTPFGDMVALTARGMEPPSATGWWRVEERVLYSPPVTGERARSDAGMTAIPRPGKAA